MTGFKQSEFLFPEDRKRIELERDKEKYPWKYAVYTCLICKKPCGPGVDAGGWITVKGTTHTCCNKHYSNKEKAENKPKKVFYRLMSLWFRMENKKRNHGGRHYDKDIPDGEGVYRGVS